MTVERSRVFGFDGGRTRDHTRSRLVVRLAPPTDEGAPLSNMVVTAGDLRVTLTVGHEPDGDYLRVVVDAPYSDVTLSAQSYGIDPDAARREAGR